MRSADRSRAISSRWRTMASRHDMINCCAPGSSSSMADHPIKAQAERLADVKYELAEAWFWLAGGDAVAAWERRCKAAKIRRGMQA